MSDPIEPGTAIITQPKAPLVAGAQIQAIVPKSIEEVFRLAEGICKADLAPSSYSRDASKVMIGLMKALELGAPPLQGLAGIAIINGRPAVWGDLAVALCQSKGLLVNHSVEWTGEYPNDDFGCTYKVWRKGQENPYVGTFTIGDAKTAKLWANPQKMPWVQYPKRMLANRARAFALRDGFADHLAGMAIAEEAMDMPPARDTATAPPAGAIPDGTPKVAALDFLEDDAPNDAEVEA